MFGKKKKEEPKEKKLSPQKILEAKIISEIESMTPGFPVIYQLSENYRYARFLIIELNPTYPEKGRKYLLSSDEMVDDKPAGKRTLITTSNKASDGANWIASRDTDQFGHAKRYQ